jgi:hypothetical protein
MEIDESDEQPWKQPLSSRKSREAASNVTFERTQQSKKQSAARISTHEGMQIE